MYILFAFIFTVPRNAPIRFQKINVCKLFQGIHRTGLKLYTFYFNLRTQVFLNRIHFPSVRGFCRFLLILCTFIICAVQSLVCQSLYCDSERYKANWILYVYLYTCDIYYKYTIYLFWLSYVNWVQLYYVCIMLFLLRTYVHMPLQFFYFYSIEFILNCI